MQTFILHTKAYYIVHTNIHFAHESILQSTYKHSFYTPKHITHKIFILYTQVYHHGRVKLGVYKTQANSNICHSCTIFQIVCSSKVLQDEHMGSCTGTTFTIHVLIEHEIWLPQSWAVLVHWRIQLKKIDLLVIVQAQENQWATCLRKMMQHDDEKTWSNCAVVILIFQY